jgi:class 3 adenylate cyclase
VPETRKLATILAVDMVGFSRATERDDSSAAEAVQKMRNLLTQIATAHGGRIFSSAGDGFMLEFPTATAGLEAALALNEAIKQLDSSLQVRIGLHTGEVIVQPDGDLLGHAVNIAARLQHRANPGEIVLSEDVRRSARGALTSNLVSLGNVKLDKMSETITIYGANIERRGLRLLRMGRRERFAAVVVALVAAGALGTALWPRPSREARIAVFPIQAPNGVAELENLSRSVRTEIIDTLNQIGVETASPSETAAPGGRTIAQRARSLGAAFAIDGELIRDGERVRASVRLNDVNGRRTLWARSFERESARAAELRLEVASVAVAVAQCAVDARRDAPELAPTNLSMLLRSCELSIISDSQEEPLRLIELVAQAAPRSSFVQGQLASASIMASFTAPAGVRERLERQASAAAEAALRIDPANEGGLAVRTDLLVYNTGSRAQWGAALAAALDKARDSAVLNYYYGYFLREHGRPEEAVPYLRRALARRPLSPEYVTTLAHTLATVGRHSEAIDILTRAEARWPGNDLLVSEIFRTNLWYGSLIDALRILDEMAGADNALTDARITQCWRRVATSLGADTEAARRQMLARGVRQCWPNEIAMLASVGEVDAAFAVTERELADCFGATASGAGGTRPVLPACIIDFPWRMFFYEESASLRRDRRFMPLMQRAGFVDYWQQTNRWPEFCDDPALPYDCRREARRVSEAAQRRQP